MGESGDIQLEDPSGVKRENLLCADGKAEVGLCMISRYENAR